ncbi:MAG: glycosyltransferase family 1 protein [Verrucomicrobiota bacterium]|nr:glycosyltransferase family 1 protein [Verrucomicrobiota bacterium]
MSNDAPITVAVMLRHVSARGGITVYTRNILTHILQADTSNRYLLLLPDRGLLGQYAAPNVTELLVESRGGFAGRIAWDQQRILRAIRGRGVDVIYNPKLSVPLRARCKTVFTMHGLEQFAAKSCFPWHDRAYFSLAMRFYCRKADAILVMTQTGRRDLRNYLDVPEAKIHVVPESYNEQCRMVRDEAERRRVREKFGLPDRFLLFVGGITPLKNIPALLRAFRALKARGIPHRLVLAGFKRLNFARDLALIEALGLRQDVIEPGFVDDADLPALYSLADAFVLPSFYEGFGIPILEAQACGCPVVVGNRGAMTEVAGEGGALSFDPDSPAELAGRLGRILNEPAVRASLAERGLENAKRYSWAVTARRTVELFEKLARA